VSVQRHMTIRYLCYGVLFGAMFPLLATALDIWLRRAPFGLSAVVLVQSTQPLHWMIDTAPFFLGLFAALAGLRQDQREQLTSALLAQQIALDRAMLQAEHATELARLNDDKERLYQQTLQQLDYLQLLQQERERDARTISALSTPIISVYDSMLVLPLIGTFQADRIIDLCGSALHAVEAQRAKIVILDCTGVDEVTPDAALELARLIDALALLGARTLITGVKPRFAQLLVMDINFHRIASAAPDLAAGIRLALKMLEQVTG